MSISGISFCEVNTAKVEQAVLTTYEGLTETVLYPGNPVRLFLEALAATIAQQRAIIDQAGKSNLVTYAKGDFLDHIGEMTDTPRLEAVKAQTIIRFTLSALNGSILTIPQGTRVTPDGKIFFATIETTDIPIKTAFIDIPCECETAGASGNGFLPGQIIKLVDPLPLIATVANITESKSGADIEQDAAYMERIILAPEKYSVGGPDGAYQFWAKSAHQDIIDVAVSSPSAGVVNIVVLALGGSVPSTEILTAVETLLNERDKRPLTDSINVLAPTQIDYDLTLTYYISKEKMPLSIQIQAQVIAAIDEYLVWQRSKLGRDINPSELTRRVMDAGAKRVSITAPVFTAMGVDQVAKDGTISVNYGGFEND